MQIKQAFASLCYRDVLEFGTVLEIPVQDAKGEYVVCPITQQELVDDQDYQIQSVTQLFCNHVFESAAIKLWEKTKTECPVCKITINPSFDRIFIPIDKIENFKKLAIEQLKVQSITLRQHNFGHASPDISFLSIDENEDYPALIVSEGILYRRFISIIGTVRKMKPFGRLIQSLPFRLIAATISLVYCITYLALVIISVVVSVLTQLLFTFTCLPPLFGLKLGKIYNIPNKYLEPIRTPCSILRDGFISQTALPFQQPS